MMDSIPTGPRGFTLVELVTAMAIVGIISVVAGPRFFDTEIFAARGYANDAQAALRYAQKLAIASGCSIDFALSSTGYKVQRWTGGTDCNDRGGTLGTVARPGGDLLESALPAGLTVTSFEVFFDAIGRPRQISDGNPLGATERFTVGSHEISVQAESGLVQ